MGILGGLSRIIYIKAFCSADDDDVSDDEQKAGGKITLKHKCLHK